LRRAASPFFKRHAKTPVFDGSRCNDVRLH
jgi:hypothetical protein